MPTTRRAFLRTTVLAGAALVAPTPALSPLFADSFRTVRRVTGPMAMEDTDFTARVDLSEYRATP